ncbi:protein of unknown function [Methylomagnum ishizawai]|uniref:Uncharacterized protein n=1 Tax=Methylomagnum ishizawai TaxID=1760988 RepID=A0A1Y6D475_9GAMM|nr:DUF4407 domain-containing protein [Methylomagnum ishizawai]SMF97406.1 protein of unknown function [Methylomagnum ishizawai]
MYNRPKPVHPWNRLKTLVRDFFTLRPHGREMAGPAVDLWIRSVWLVIFLMALVEALVWAMIGGFIAPGEGWTDTLVAAFAASGVFLLVWVVDSSFVMAERPLLRRGAPPDGDRPVFDGDASWSWGAGIAIRIGIVLISLCVTAPLLTLVLNKDRIDQLYQDKKIADEKKLAGEAKAKLQRDVEAKTARVDSELGPLQAQIADLEQRKQRLSENMGDPESAYKAGLDKFQAEIDRLKQDIQDEIDGKRGKPGCGSNCEALQRNLHDKEKQRDTLRGKVQKAASQQGDTLSKDLAHISRQIAELEPKVDQLNAKKRQLLAEFNAESSRSGTDGKIESKLVLSLATQWELLEEILARERQERMALRYGDAAATTTPGWIEKIADHLRSVDGLAQAVLAMLFLSLLALKFFEPKSVRLYFNEALQLKWRDYLNGAFERTPGFPPATDPARRFNHIDFARAYLAYTENPAAFIDDHVARLEREAGAVDRLAQEDFARKLAAAHLDHELAQATQRAEEREATAHRQAERDQALFETQLAMVREKFQAEIDQRTRDWQLEQERMTLELGNQRTQFEGEFAAKLREDERLFRELEQTHTLAMAQLRGDFRLKLQSQRDEFLKEQQEAWDARAQAAQQRIGTLHDETRQLAADLDAARKNSARIEGEAQVIEAEIARLDSEIQGYMRAIAQADPAHPALLASLNSLRVGLENQLPAKQRERAVLREEGAYLKDRLRELEERRQDTARSLAEAQAIWKLCQDQLADLRPTPSTAEPAAEPGSDGDAA